MISGSKATGDSDCKRYDLKKHQRPKNYGGTVVAIRTLCSLPEEAQLDR